MSARGLRVADDGGATLIELIVYIAIATLVTGLMAGLFAAGLGSERATRERDTATGRAQLVNDSLTASIRNADAFRIDGAVLRAKVGTGASAWECRAWAVVDGDLRYTRSAAAIPLDSVAAWPVLAAGAAGTLGAGAPFAATGDRLSFGMTLTAGDSAVALTGGVVAQASAEGAGPTCW